MLKNRLGERESDSPGEALPEATSHLLPDPVRSSPDQWARSIFPSEQRPHPDLWKHAVAAAMHGWAAHAHHAGAPIQLTEADYRGAIDAATGAPGAKPHAQALSQHRGES